MSDAQNTVAKGYEKGDLLKSDFLNSRQWLVKLFDGSLYDLDIIDIQTGCLRFNVCGKSQLSHLSEVSKLVDWDGNEFETDDFYVEEIKMTTKNQQALEALDIVANKARNAVAMECPKEGVADALEHQLGQYIETIRAALTKLEQLRNDIEGMRKSYSMSNVSQDYNEGYNQALDDVLKMLGEK